MAEANPTKETWGMEMHGWGATMVPQDAKDQQRTSDESKMRHAKHSVMIGGAVGVGSYLYTKSANYSLMYGVGAGAIAYYMMIKGYFPMH